MQVDLHVGEAEVGDVVGAVDAPPQVVGKTLQAPQQQLALLVRRQFLQQRLFDQVGIDPHRADARRRRGRQHAQVVLQHQPGVEVGLERWLRRAFGVDAQRPDALHRGRCAVRPVRPWRADLQVAPGQVATEGQVQQHHHPEPHGALRQAAAVGQRQWQRRPHPGLRQGAGAAGLRLQRAEPRRGHGQLGQAVFAPVRHGELAAGDPALGVQAHHHHRHPQRPRRRQFVEVNPLAQRLGAAAGHAGRGGGQRAVVQLITAPAHRRWVVDVETTAGHRQLRRRCRTAARTTARTAPKRVTAAAALQRRQAGHHAVLRLERQPQVVGGQQLPGLVALHPRALRQVVAKPLAPAAAVARTGQAVGGTAAVQREGHAVDRRAGQPQHRRRHRQLHPGAGAGQVAGAVVRGAAVGAAQRQQVFAPISALLPAAAGAGAVPLQHQRARWLLGVEADPGEQRFAHRHRKRRGGAVEEVLVQAGHQRTAVAAAGRWFTPGRQRLALDRLRIVFVGGHRRGLAAQGVGQHRAAPAQALAQAQSARAVQPVTRQSFAKQRVDQLGEQQPRLPALQRHRHQQAHGLGGV